MTPVLNGGTSASAPEIAAAAAVVLQAARLTHHQINPLGVRDLLEKTGRAVATPAQQVSLPNDAGDLNQEAILDAIFSGMP